jgi:catechol 2,3-dioxygenase
MPQSKIVAAIKRGDNRHRLNGFVARKSRTYDFAAFNRSRSYPMFSLISQLSHVEITTPRPDQSLRFFVEVMGMTETGRKGQSVYLRSWRNFFNHDLVLTEGAQPGLKHIGWRSAGPKALEAAIARLDKAGCGLGWHEGEPGRPRGYRYRSPGGHVHEIFWDCERWKAPKELAATYPNRPQRYKPRGIAVNHIDHVTVPTRDIMTDVAFFRDTLDYRFTEWTVLDDKSDLVVFAMMTTNEQAHDLGILGDHSGIPGRIHHLAYYLDQRLDVERAADILMEADIPVEYGPGRHGMGFQTYLYFREPGGMRIELNSGGWRNYQPDWEAVRWSPAMGSNDFYRTNAFPQSMMEAFPPNAAPASPSANVVNPWAAASVS